MSETTFVLVPGAWNGAWIWRLLGEELTRRGVLWVSLDLPSATRGAPGETYLADDAREVIAVSRDLGPVVLVGHSYGGAVVAEAAAQIPDLQGIIYVAAYVPEVGQSTTEASRTAMRTLLDSAIVADGDHLRLDPARAREALYGDCDEAIAEWALENLSTQTLASLRSPRVSPDAGVPTRYVMCTLDEAVDPVLQSRLAATCDETVALASGHCPQLSRPGSLCDLVTAPFAVALED